MPGSISRKSLLCNSKQVKQAGRYRIIPASGPQYLDGAAAKTMSPNFLSEELRTRLVKTPVTFHLLLQLAEPGDQTNDGSVVWPDDRKCDFAHRLAAVGSINWPRRSWILSVFSDD